jgi:hypothetical protein
VGITVRSRGRTGEILVEDEREDGTLVFLVCRPWDSSGANGVLVGPGESPEADRALLGDFPIIGIRSVAPPFRIIIDTSRLPSGPLQFDSERFIEHAALEAAHGADHVRLDLESAPKWGLIEG